MAQELSDRRDMDFVLYEQLEMEKLIQHEKFSGFNRKALDLILTEARKLAIKELMPINAAGDREGCRFENGIRQGAGVLSQGFQAVPGRRMDRDAG